LCHHKHACATKGKEVADKNYHLLEQHQLFPADGVPRIVIVEKLSPERRQIVITVYCALRRMVLILSLLNIDFHEVFGKTAPVID